MPSATARRLYEDQIPPFMSVFDLDAETIADQETVTLVDPKFVDMDPKAPSLVNPSQQHAFRTGVLPSDPSHRHHDSTSTQTSESAESSPTTTLSTTDSSPLSDPSPSSSPDSPINLIPLNNFPSTTFGMYSGMSGLQTDSPSSSNNNLSVVEQLPSLQRPMTSPSPRRARNMKGLSIQPPFASSSTSIAQISEPSSPSFIKPKIPAMKRKPSQLSLKTNSSDLITKTTLEVPPSPAMPPILQRRALKHCVSTPHMLSGLKSSTFGPPGGMSFPKVLERNESGLSEFLRPMKSSMKATFDTTITEEDSPIKSQMANRLDNQPVDESENNEDTKTPGYPDGPIAIYGDNVFLYMEPTAEEASRFDLVINVAREVSNPFEIKAQQGFSRFKPADDSPIPDTAISACSFTTAFEYPPDDGSDTPTTPKAMQFRNPEYIHMPWDHNTDIAPDLMGLCETIDKRTKEGKKVLVHCQQGASRSASLIIAYGLYMKPELSVNDAYYAAQAKSRWISPNMKLMYSLQDFQKQVAKTRLPSTTGFRGRPGRSPTKHRLTLSADAIDMPSNQPLTAPLPEDDEKKDKGDGQSSNRLRGNSTPGLSVVTPGPQSAPPIYNWMEQVEQSAPQVPPVPAQPGQFGFPDPPQSPGFNHGFPTLAPPVDPYAEPLASPGLSHATFGFQSMSSFPRFNPQPMVQPLAPPPKRQVQRKRSYEDRPVTRTIEIPSRRYDEEDEALMSPRAEIMTNNPLHEFPKTEFPRMEFPRTEFPRLEITRTEFPDIGGMRFSESPPPPSIAEDGLFSPRIGAFPRDPFGSFGSFGTPDTVADPRSPATKGEAPIIRSIDDLI